MSILKNKINKLIKKYEEKKDFTYSPLSLEMINDSENKLGIKLPDDFLWFLNTYGAGGIGFDVFGVAGKELEFVKETMYNRSEDMPWNLLAIENCDEWIYCIDCDNGKVLMWSPWEGLSDYCYNSFSEYLLDRLESSTENLK